jgi:hypothetical protein
MKIEVQAKRFQAALPRPQPSSQVPVESVSKAADRVQGPAVLANHPSVIAKHATDPNSTTAPAAPELTPASSVPKPVTSVQPTTETPTQHSLDLAHILSLLEQAKRPTPDLDPNPTTKATSTYDAPTPEFTQSQLLYLARLYQEDVAFREEGKEVEKALEDSNGRAAEWQGKYERLQREMAEKKGGKEKVE